MARPRHPDPDPGPHGGDPAARQAARRHRRQADDRACHATAPRRPDLGEVIVATDSEPIQAAVEKAGGRALMTRADHASGSDRIFEALQIADPDGRVADRRQCAGRPADARSGRSARRGRRCSTIRRSTSPRWRPRSSSRRRAHQSERGEGRRLAGRPGTAARALFHPRHRALWRRARSIITSGSTPTGARRWSASSRCRPRRSRQREKLEQLRALEAGMRIDVAIVASVPLGVDTPEDLETARRMLARDR